SHIVRCAAARRRVLCARRGRTTRRARKSSMELPMHARATLRVVPYCLSLLACLLGSASANAEPAACDSSCLKGFVDGYVDALSHRDPKALPVATAVKYTENGRVLDLGEGLWRTAGAPLRYHDYLLDADSGQAAALTAVTEYEGVAQLAVRLKIVNRQIAQI